MTDGSAQAPGWYYAEGDPPGTQRYWDGAQWQGGPQPVAGAGGPMAMGAATNADGGKRLAAWLVDALVLIIPLGIVSAVIGGTSQEFTAFSIRQWIANVITTLLWFAYHYFMNANGGQTVGRKVLNIKIVDVAGGEAQSEALLKRFGFGFLGFVPVVGGLILFVAGLASLVMIFVDDQNQAVWDKFANTKTIVV